MVDTIGVTLKSNKNCSMRKDKNKVQQTLGPRLNIKTIFPRYGDSHVKDKKVTRPWYL